VTIGAYHAHGLEGKLKAKYLPDSSVAEGEAPAEPIQETDRRYREKYDEDKNGRMSRDESLAFIAHQMHICDVAAKYQMYHALALLGIGILTLRSSSKLLTFAAILMLLGVVGFSGGLYADVFDGNRSQSGVLIRGLGEAGKLIWTQIGKTATT
jgi:uncharacterized membrane protein YgdD (TMEM256/DUF423 family)